MSRNISAIGEEILENASKGQFAFVEKIENGESNWSKEAVEYFGFSDCKISNTIKVIQDITHPEDQKRIMEEFENVRSKGKKLFYMTFRMRNAEGEYVPCTCKGNLICDEKGNPYNFIGTVVVHKKEHDIDIVTDLPKLQSFLDNISQVKSDNKEYLLMALELKHFNIINT